MLVVTSLLDTLLVRPQVACACEEQKSQSQLYETSLSIGWVCVCVVGWVLRCGGILFGQVEVKFKALKNKKPRQTQGERERRVMADRNRRRTEREREGESERE